MIGVEGGGIFLHRLGVSGKGGCKEAVVGRRKEDRDAVWLTYTFTYSTSLMRLSLFMSFAAIYITSLPARGNAQY